MIGWISSIHHSTSTHPNAITPTLLLKYWLYQVEIFHISSIFELSPYYHDTSTYPLRDFFPSTMALNKGYDDTHFPFRYPDFLRGGNVQFTLNGHESTIFGEVSEHCLKFIQAAPSLRSVGRYEPIVINGGDMGPRK